MTDIEDALRRLDKLTREEARMATTQVLKATRSVDDSVRGVGDRVAGVDGRVRTIDGKVAKIMDGTRTISSQSPKTSDFDTPRREYSKGSHATNS